MISKILTFALFLQSPISNKEAVKKILIDRGYELKYYEYGMMIGYSKDGKRLKNKFDDSLILGDNMRNDKYQLRGKYCLVDFSSDSPTILCQFGTKLEQTSYDLAKNMQEIQSIIKILGQFANYDVSPCELLVAIGVQGKQNSEHTILALQKMHSNTFTIKDLDEIIPKQNLPTPKSSKAEMSGRPRPSPAENLEVHYKSPLSCKSKNTESIIRVRDGNYAITLRFESIGVNNLLEDLQNCEQFGTEMIEKLETS